MNKLKNFEPFKNVAEDKLEKLEKNLEFYRFEVGQPICRRKNISNKIHFIITGSARLLGEQRGKPYTVAKLKPGSSIGIASLLRADPCEEVSAIDQTTTMAISDEDFLDLYRNESGNTPVF